MRRNIVAYFQVAHLNGQAGAVLIRTTSPCKKAPHDVVLSALEAAEHDLEQRNARRVLCGSRSSEGQQESQERERERQLARRRKGSGCGVQVAELTLCGFGVGSAEPRLQQSRVS